MAPPFDQGLYHGTWTKVPNKVATLNYFRKQINQGCDPDLIGNAFETGSRPWPSGGAAQIIYRAGVEQITGGAAQAIYRAGVELITKMENIWPSKTASPALCLLLKIARFGPSCV